MDKSELEAMNLVKHMNTKTLKYHHIPLVDDDTREMLMIHAYN
jgi:hypothetical protein